MKNIGLYSKGSSSSQYIEELKEKQCTFIPISAETKITRHSNLDGIILDYTDSLSKEALGEICGLLFNFQQSEVPVVFILLKESTKVERMILLRLGATLVFDQGTEPDEFAIIFSNLLLKEKEADTSIDAVEQGIELDKRKLTVQLEGETEVFLTPLEYKLLDFLKQKQAQGATYEEIYQALWGDDMGEKRYRVANIVFHVRHKIERDSLRPKYLKTIRSVGYAFYG